MFFKYRRRFVLLCLSCVLLTVLTGFYSSHKEFKKTISFDGNVPSVTALTRIFSPHKDFKRTTTVADNVPSVCVERKRIAFVKVHKAASTTVTTILQRYGMNHNLTFALGTREKPFHIGFFETLHPKNLFPMPNGTIYDILCQHVVYNEEAFAKYLPADIRVIAAVREPLERFVSGFQYKDWWTYPHHVVKLSNLTKQAPVTDLMREFLRKPEYYEPEGLKNGSLLVNRMSFDLGIPKQQYKNSTFVKDYIKMLDRNLELVLVAEHFDMSLVILKRRMCWSTKDILYLTRHKGNTIKPTIPDDISKRLKELCPSDYQLYDYFSKKFLIISAAEVNLQAEVDLFKEINHNVTDFCQTWRISKPVLTIDKTLFSEGFNVTKEDCVYLQMEEIGYVKLLQDHYTALHQSNKVNTVHMLRKTL